MAQPAVQPDASGHAAWPALPLAEWQGTQQTLHLWTQIVGKTRLALAPMQNHWWQVTLYVTSRGLTTSAMPHDTRSLEIEFDFIDHQLVARASDGAVRTIPLQPRSVAEFYEQYRDMLRRMDMDVVINPVPCELVEVIPFDEDRVHAEYDPDAVTRCWRALVQAHRAMATFRGQFLGKCSPVHFFWGSFDLACTRFSGRTAPPHPGGIPHLADWVTREAYSHECASAGWWPGGGAVTEPAFYAYTYPEPAGYADARVAPEGTAYYHSELREWLLPYDAVRQARDPDALLGQFLQSSYAAAADLGRWDRAALERSSS
ncbi:MAG TPA: DUF5996 family protein [Gemmatimonadaceae bacterium]|nr:DUF5996 family protein [Gemmatimonadaceae bacterium]